MTHPAGFDYRVREKLTANTTYYVRTDGNDSNTGLANTSGGAFLTIQAAVNTVALLDASGYTITIQVADGTYTGAVTLKNVVGIETGSLIIQGNNATPSNVIISTTSATCFTATGLSTPWDIKDLKVQTTTSGGCFALSYGSLIRLSAVEFGACAGSHISCLSNSKVYIMASYTISGGATSYHWFASSGGVIYGQSITVTLSASMSFSAFAAASILGKIVGNASTYSWGAYTITATKYTATLNGVIYTNTATLPGATAGSTATGGQYL